LRIPTSPYYILVFLSRQGLILLSLPFQAFLLKNINPYIAAYVYITDLFLILTLIVFACLSRRNLNLTLKNKSLLLEKGVIIKNRTLVANDTVSVISTIQTPLQRLLRIHKVIFVSSKNQLTLYLSKKLLPALSKDFIHQKVTSRLIFKNGFIQTFFLSAGFYNAFTGALTLIPVLKKLTTLTTPAHRQRDTLSTLQAVTSHQDLNFILNALISAIIGLWGIGVLITFFRYYNLSVYKSGNFIETAQGLFVRRHTKASTKNISAIVLRQNILMTLLHRYTGEFRIACEGKENKLTFVCSEHHRCCLGIIALLIKNFKAPKGEKLRPNKKALLSYTLLPLLSLIAFSVFSVTADIYSPYVSKTRFGLFVSLWLCVWLIFRIVVFKRCFITSDNKTLLLCTYSKLTFCKAYIPLSKIHSFKLTQSFFQKRLGTCSLRIFLRNRRPLSFKIKHIDSKKAAELLKKLCGISL